MTAVAAAREHWLDKDGVPLFLVHRPAATASSLGAILFVHGSSMSAVPSFDLDVPQAGYVSPMAWFAAAGFDTWAVDCEGYGRSGKSRAIPCGVETGADDVRVAATYIRAQCGGVAPFVFGVSSGALRAGRCAERHPELVRKLALDAVVWTGEGSRTLHERRKRLPEYEAALRRPISRESVRSIFTRDHEGIADDTFLDAFADAVIALDPSVPNGTYVDMCRALPLLDPRAIAVPTIVVRGEYDGIATWDDVAAFFGALATADKQLAVLAATGHGAFHGKNALAAYHVIRAFFTQPEPA